MLRLLASISTLQLRPPALLLADGHGLSWRSSSRRLLRLAALDAQHVELAESPQAMTAMRRRFPADRRDARANNDGLALAWSVCCISALRRRSKPGSVKVI